ncbi:zinc-dependent alcohol dehydrogenase family protein [Algiphilus sp.]|uniref:zinc-dependent alcohol dehydrogenase family protein n=1 Tax=Algiphilus sp. TaxID=1872431 RepID=UPI003C47D662
MIDTRGAVLREMGASTPYADSRPLRIEPLQLEPPGPDEMLVRVRAAGVCHSDLSVVNGSRPRPLPMVLGHEAAGDVEAVGAGVTDFAPGDRVVFSFVPSCGRCAFCAEGRPVLCAPGAAANAAGTLLSGARRWRDADGRECQHHLGVSAFAERTVVSTRSAVRVDPELPVEIAALFGCAVMTGVGAAVNTAGVRPGESVVVFGMGGVGLAALLGAVAAGAWPVVAVDPVGDKRELAAALGASHTIDAGEDDVVERIRAITGGGAQRALETVGSEKVLEQAYFATARGGMTVTVGLPHPQRMLSIPAVSLVAEERTLAGSYMGSAVVSRDVPRFLDLYRAGRLPVDRLLTHRLSLDDINAAFDRLARAEAVRQVILF